MGASTIARNLAWSIAERQDACAALIDLDLAFGAAAFSLGKAGAQAMADALSAPDAVNDAMLARAAVQHTKHLQLLAGPAALERGAELEPEAVEALVRCARRANPYVVLDLPHAWTPWVKQALAGADEVVLVAAPDLASLRNAKSMVETLAPLRADKSPVLCALSMTGVPKRPEISAKDFTETVGVSPAASFAFEPLLFGQCETSNQMIGEADPLSKTAAALDALATVLTGRKPNPRKRAPDAAILARDVPADFAKSPKRGLRDSAPAPSENVLVLTRAKPASARLPPLMKAMPKANISPKRAPPRKANWTPARASARACAGAASALRRPPPRSRFSASPGATSRRRSPRSRKPPPRPRPPLRPPPPRAMPPRFCSSAKAARMKRCRCCA
ncbi:MAG: hypothetical protein NVV62_04845 [Terricaulis sp.]|nr:hypothetical protein [Terricaulis sp.]